MGSLSIRGIDKHLSATLKKQALAAQKSVNQFVLEILRKRVGLDKEKRFTREYDDLNNLFGKWSAEEFDRIQGKINSERRIDNELWNE